MNKLKYITTHEELLSLHGKSVTCKIIGIVIEDGKIAVENDRVYICQNKMYYPFTKDRPGYKYSWLCSKSGNRLEHRDDVEELKLKNPNEMPAIEAGMVIETEWVALPTSLALIGATNVAYDLNGEEYIHDYRKVTKITKVFKVTGDCSFNTIKDNLELIWELEPPKTEAELKIEELEQTVKTALDRIEEIKGGK